MREKLEVLIVDDDEVTRHLLQEVLEREGFQTQSAPSGEAAVKLIRGRVFPIIVSDIRMLELDGLSVLREAKLKSQASAVILMTGFGSMEGAIDAIRAGAFDYVSKPFRLEQIQAVVQRAARHWVSLAGEAMRRAARKSEEGPQDPPKVLIGKSPKIVEVYKALAHAALSRTSVLLRGESGTGKSRVARAIHDHGDRREHAFVSWACVPGSSIGSLRSLVSQVGEGTVYLEEVGHLSPALQVELLHLVEDAQCPARVIVATQLDLDHEVKQGRFREDLYYLLRVITIDLPPLRERVEDLPELVESFVVHCSRRNRKAISHVAPEVMKLFASYPWPGNIRELEHLIERAIVMTNSSVLFREDFPELLSKVSSQLALREGSLEDLEKAHILKVLSETRFNKSKASDVLGIDRATLYRKAQRYGIDLRSR